MSFGDILAQSWKDYKNNFRSIFKLMVVFVLIPGLIVTIIDLLLLFSNNALAQLMLNPLELAKISSSELLSSSELFKLSSSELFKLYPSYFIINTFLSFVLLSLSLFIGSSLISASIKKDNYSYKELINSGKNSYFRYIGFFIVSWVFLTGLFLLLIIPGIIFMIYWSFGVYVLFDEKKGIVDSLKRSKEIVKGKWWRVFGYFILILLILNFYGVNSQKSVSASSAPNLVFGFTPVPIPIYILLSIIITAKFTLPLIISF